MYLFTTFNGLLYLSLITGGILLFSGKHPSFAWPDSDKLFLKKLSDFTIKDIIATIILLPSVLITLAVYSLLILLRKLVKKSKLMKFLDTKPFATKVK